MQVHGPAFLHGAQSIGAPHRVANSPATAEAAYAAPTDQLDISPEASLISRMADIPEIRADRVAEIKAQIASGVYETEAKLDVALDRLLDELA